MPSCKEIEAGYLEALEAARRKPRPGLGRDVVIAYTGPGKAAAHTLYLAMTHAGVEATLAHATVASVHILPYRETGTVVAFTLDDRDARIVNLAMAARLLGSEAYIISPRPHPAVEEAIESTGATIIELESTAPLAESVITSLLWRPPLMGAREERMRREIEALDSAAEWACERYGDLADTEPGPAYYSPTALPAGVHHRVLGYDARPLEDVAVARRGEEAIVYLAGVEEHDYKDLLFRARINGARLRVARIDTDPVTGSLYSLLAAAVHTGRLT